MSDNESLFKDAVSLFTKSGNVLMGTHNSLLLSKLSRKKKVYVANSKNINYDGRMNI